MKTDFISAGTLGDVDIIVEDIVPCGRNIDKRGFPAWRGRQFGRRTSKISEDAMFGTPSAKRFVLGIGQNGSEFFPVGNGLIKSDID
jgi:hypothetical protein